MRSLLRVHLNDKTHHIESTSGEYAGLGGRGLTSRIVRNEVPPECNPLGSDNKLVIAAGLLAGTSVPNSGRLSIGAKSPLTHTIKEANSGGTAAQKLIKLGFQAMAIEGTATEPCILKIDTSGINFIPAGIHGGTGNYALFEALKHEYGDQIAIISIGPAGEMELKASAIAVSTPDFHIRTASRGGLGAVMGSKNVKAILIDDRGTPPVPVADKGLLKEAVKALTEGIATAGITEAFKELGTPMLVGMINELGALVTKNFSTGRFDGAEKISGEHLYSLIQSRPNAATSHRCMPGCIVSCSNILTDKNGQLIVSGLEYETIALMGSNCMIDDMDTIAHMNRICNDVGVDTMDVGGAMAVAMEAGLLPWGDGNAALDLLSGIGSGSENGRMIGNGCKYTGERLGLSRIPHVKSQCLSGYDPRVLKGTGVTYATSPMGADHTCGNALPGPANPDYNPLAPTGQGPVSQFLQTFFAAIDTLGICLFAALPLLDEPSLQDDLARCAFAILGDQHKEDYIMQLGDSVLKVEKQFNDAAGFTREDDRLPEFFRKETLQPSGTVFDVSDEELDSVHG